MLFLIYILRIMFKHEFFSLSFISKAGNYQKILALNYENISLHMCLELSAISPITQISNYRIIFFLNRV